MWRIFSKLLSRPSQEFSVGTACSSPLRRQLSRPTAGKLGMFTHGESRTCVARVSHGVAPRRGQIACGSRPRDQLQLRDWRRKRNRSAKSAEVEGQWPCHEADGAEWRVPQKLTFISVDRRVDFRRGARTASCSHTHEPSDWRAGRSQRSSGIGRVVASIASLRLQDLRPVNLAGAKTELSLNVTDSARAAVAVLPALRA